MSWMRWLTLDTFICLNPEWEVHLYTPPKEMIIPRHWTSIADDDNSYRGLDYRERLHSSIQVHTFHPPTRMAAAQMCDLFQWNLLATDGGMYADMDILWLKPMDDILVDFLDSDIILCLESGFLAIGLVGSSPNCVLFQRVAKGAKRIIKSNTNYQHYGVSLIYCLFGVMGTRGRIRSDVKPVMRNIRKNYPNLRLSELPSNSIYPFNWRQTNKIFEERNIVPDDKLGLHWFGGCPISNRWNNLLTEENWTEHKNTFTDCLRKLQE